mmetsp:Transcript_12321/g.25875  ORF Transcript_12321/g.25875 Transcript_12321/m.25875 type:complete len:246 (+) Transcript_12321:837-1574(+)
MPGAGGAVGGEVPGAGEAVRDGHQLHRQWPPRGAGEVSARRQRQPGHRHWLRVHAGLPRPPQASGGVAHRGGLRDHPVLLPPVQSPRTRSHCGVVPQLLRLSQLPRGPSGRVHGSALLRRPDDEAPAVPDGAQRPRPGDGRHGAPPPRQDPLRPIRRPLGICDGDVEGGRRSLLRPRAPQAGAALCRQPHRHHPGEGRPKGPGVRAVLAGLPLHPQLPVRAARVRGPCRHSHSQVCEEARGGVQR